MKSLAAVITLIVIVNIYSAIAAYTTMDDAYDEPPMVDCYFRASLQNCEEGDQIQILDDDTLKTEIVDTQAKHKCFQSKCLLIADYNELALKGRVIVGVNNGIEATPNVLNSELNLDLFMTKEECLQSDIVTTNIKCHLKEQSEESDSLDSEQDDLTSIEQSLSAQPFPASVTSNNQYAYSMGTISWANNWKQDFTWQCPRTHQAIYYMSSVHYNRYEDRRYRFQCKQAGEQGLEQQCYGFTKYLNAYDGYLSAYCRSRYFLVGVKSRYDTSFWSPKRDRQFSIKCCSITGYRTVNCKTSDYINQWDRYGWYWPGPEEEDQNRFITGLLSEHSNKREDRRWRVYTCDYIKP